MRIYVKALSLLWAIVMIHLLILSSIHYIMITFDVGIPTFVFLVLGVPNLLFWAVRLLAGSWIRQNHQQKQRLEQAGK